MKVVGVAIILLALIIAIVPLFTDCESQGRSLTLENGKTIPMKCHWTGRAELIAATPIFTLGFMDIVNRRAIVFRNLSILGVLLGALVILLPTNLIGVCGSPDMLCNSVMRPTLILSGLLVIVFSLIGLRISLKPEDIVY